MVPSIKSMAFTPKVLAVSNQQRTSPLWGTSLTQSFQIVFEFNPAMALHRCAETLPDLVVLELESEPLAIELITNLRNEASIPVLLVSSICTEKFMLAVYQAGVDDYIHKPIHPSLFYAKLKAWLRHSWTVPVGMLDPLSMDGVKLIPTERMLLLFVNRAPIRLTILEVRLLHILMRRPGYIATTEELCQRIWGGSREEDVISLKNVVYRLRRKIEADPAKPQYLITVPGVGYQFKAK